MKNILRIIVRLLVCFAVCYSLGQFFRGTNNWFDYVVLITFGIFIAFKLFVFISDYMFYTEANEFYKLYKETFEMLKTEHKERYKMYFSGNKEEIETVTKRINEIGEMLIEDGEKVLRDKIFEYPTDKEIRNIINQVKELMGTIQTPE